MPSAPIVPMSNLSTSQHHRYSFSLHKMNIKTLHVRCVCRVHNETNPIDKKTVLHSHRRGSIHDIRRHEVPALSLQEKTQNVYDTSTPSFLTGSPWKTHPSLFAVRTSTRVPISLVRIIADTSLTTPSQDLCATPSFYDDVSALSPLIFSKCGTPS